MTVTPEQIQALVEDELSGIRDQRVVLHVRSLLVKPTVVLREWDYGEPGESYPCWSVLAHSKSNTGISYCEFGFGPRNPWGLVFLSEDSRLSIGMDSGWFATFMEAFFESQAAAELPIWRVFKQVGDPYPGTPITEESDWESTWNEIYEQRAADPDSRYNCSHSIRLRDE